MISRQTIDQIFAQSRLEEVIGDFVRLKKSGSNFKGLSPFSDERTPSFMVSPAKQIWKDFSSGKGGNVVSFLMEHEQFTYPEALRWLAKRYGIEVEEDNKEQSDEEKKAVQKKESLYLLNEFASTFFQEQIKSSEEGKLIGLSYFKERGFSPEIIEKFKLGYSPKEWKAFADYALEKGYSKELLNDSGLVIFKEDNYFDRFRERVIFPIQSFSGRTLGFGARILRNDKKAAKYLNSPETEIYHKSKILYGIYQSKPHILKADNCLLVEGYTDVISLHQAGVQNVVASSGTALTTDQIRLIKRLTNHVTLLYDGDAAGIRASFRGIDLILEQELDIKVVLFPDGEDPDSFARKNSQEELQDYLSNEATDFLAFKAGILLKESGDDPVQKTEVLREMISSIALIPSLIKRELYIRQTAKMMDFREEVLFGELAQILSKNQREQNRTSRSTPSQLSVVPKTEKAPEIDPKLLLEEELMQLLLYYGNFVLAYTDADGNEQETSVTEEIVHHFKEDQLEFSVAAWQNMFLEIANGLENNELRTADYFLKENDDAFTAILAKSGIQNETISERWKERGIYIKPIEEGIEKKVHDCVLNLKIAHLNDMIQSGMNLFESAEIEGEARSEQMQKIMQLTAYKNQILQHLNRIVG